ncbi:MAG: ribbon-helix-helix domain-containing protein [Candidatus Njordarchaeota archaeon]
MKVISIRLPDWVIENIDRLCELGVFISRSEFIRYAIRLALKRYEQELQKSGEVDGRILRISWKIHEDAHPEYDYELTAIPFSHQKKLLVIYPRNIDSFFVINRSYRICLKSPAGAVDLIAIFNADKTFTAIVPYDFNVSMFKRGRLIVLSSVQ